MASPPPQTMRPALSPPPAQSLIARLIIAPLTFISFLLSLFLVDTFTTSRRRNAHAPPAPPTFAGRMRQRVRKLFWKPQAQSPYSTVRAPGSVESPSSNWEKEGEVWVWHTNQRKMLRMEVVDAFELRKWVVVAMGVVVVTLGLAGSWICFWVWGKSRGMGRRR